MHKAGGASLVALLVTIGACGSVTPTAAPASPQRSASPVAAATPIPSALASGSTEPSASTAIVECVNVPPVQSGVCDMIATAALTEEPEAAEGTVRIVIADACPEQVLCERTFFYDSAVVLVGKSGEPVAAPLRVFGHVGQTLSVEPWQGPLPIAAEVRLK